MLSAMARAMESVERAILASPSRVFLLGWVLVVTGVGLRSMSWALVSGGALIMAVVLIGAIRR